MKISLLLGLIFIISNQPMFMIGILMMLVLFYSLYIYYAIGSFWYGYILMLVLLSGVLVIFTYVISLIPNESFEFFSMFLFFMIFMYMFFNEYYYLMGLDLSFSCLCVWEDLMLGYMLYLVNFLLMIMIMVIFVSYPQIGALRVYNYAW